MGHRVYPSRASTFCGAAFASCSVTVEAFTRICARVNALVSAAKSASRIKLSAAVTFSSATPNELMFVVSVFRWKAPSRPRSVEI